MTKFKLNNEAQEKHLENMLKADDDCEVVANFGGEMYHDGACDMLLYSAIVSSCAYLLTQWVIPTVKKVIKH